MATNEKTPSSLKGIEQIAPFDPYGCKDVDKYEKLAKIGQGTFGEVFKARERGKNRFVALKKVLMDNEKEGFPITALREIKILQRLKHENIINLIEVCKESSSENDLQCNFILVFDFCEHDLAGLLSNKDVRFRLGHIKMIIKQLLNGLFFMGVCNILHRDIKAANILITKTGVLKIADFGLARSMDTIRSADKPNRYTNRVVTLWYRPPELLLGERNYGPAIDIWGAGCIMAEMWTRSPLMQGTNETHQLMLITQLCGSITPQSYPGCENLDLYQTLKLPKGRKRSLVERLKPFVGDKHALDLIDQMLLLDPEKRIDCDNALNHEFFWTEPLPCNLSTLLEHITRSNFEYLTSARNRNAKKSVAKVPRPNENEGYQDRVF